MPTAKKKMKPMTSRMKVIVLMNMTDSGIKDEIIQRAIQKVSPAYREMVILRDIQQLSYEEISEITGITVGTVKSRINRGRAQLQELLKDIYKE